MKMLHYTLCHVMCMYLSTHDDNNNHSFPLILHTPFDSINNFEHFLPNFLLGFHRVTLILMHGEFLE